MRIVATLVVGLAVALAGCGSSGSSSAKARYVSKAEALCKAARAQTGPLIDDLTAASASIVTGGPAPARLAGDLVRLHAVGAGYLAQLKQLKQPNGDHAAIQRFLTPFTKIVDELGAAASAVAAGQLPQAMALLQHAGPVAQDASSGAQAYGLSRCAEVLPPLQ
jgi:hypothetical protein